MAPVQQAPVAVVVAVMVLTPHLRPVILDQPAEVVLVYVAKVLLALVPAPVSPKGALAVRAAGRAHLPDLQQGH